jgi:hypothetical protein
MVKSISSEAARYEILFAFLLVMCCWMQKFPSTNPSQTTSIRLFQLIYTVNKTLMYWKYLLLGYILIVIGPTVNSKLLRTKVNSEVFCYILLPD